ncbi:hypothetical protein INT47_003378 [Mucor saturninus]|uniref:GCS light chain n=1 Tax=Mucor saturninus TaxID=64648 RepID=A0A8H7RG06_9FUNG|nr:hypothetical protein INT47_003378 [Mucor saturninus]
MEMFLPKEKFPSSYQHLALYTGNIVKSVIGRNSVLDKKTNMEILDAINNTLDYGDRLNYRYYKDTKLVEIPDLRSSSKIDPEDRDHVEITAKLFYLDSVGQETYADEAWDHLNKLLDINHIDTLITSNNRYWKSLENLVNLGKVQNLGVTDLSRHDLEDFLNQVEIKPKINHIHVGECCHMPLDLIQLAKDKHIELLHNGDCTTILKTCELTHLLQKYDLVRDEVFIPRWVLKYTVFIRSRNIVTDKG